MLWVSKSGARNWVQRLRVDGRRHDIGLGGFPVVSLAGAREAALENKRIVANGGNPLIEKRQTKLAARQRITFKEATIKAHKELSPTWKNPKDRAAFLSTLDTYAWPYFGDVPIPDVTSAQIRRAILDCRKKRPGVAQKLIYRIAAVFRWSIAENYCDINPANRESLALPRYEHKTTNRRALPYKDVASAIETVNGSNAWGATKLAIEFCVLTAARSGEVRGAKWSEIDFKTASWTVDGARMKMEREHRVPLSDRSLDVLARADRLKDSSGLIFPSQRGRELSDMTLSKLVRELGIPSTIHGFRTSFRTWAQECTNVPSEVAEAALAHINSNKVEAAYARSDLFEKRRALMDRWAAFLSESSAKVVRLV